MISEIVVACMAVFMVIGAADKALFNNRFGYGEEFERGLSAMGPLAMCLVGVMCAAPAIGRAAAPALGPLFTAIGSDPSVEAGMIFGIDSGGLTLSIALAATHEAAMLSGLGLAASMGCVITYALPVSLSMCAPRSRPAVAKGLAAGIVAAPVSLFGVAAVSGYSLSGAFITGIPAFLIGGLMAFLLITRQDAAVRGCVLFGKLMMAAFVLLLAAAAIEHWFALTLIPGMDPIGKQLEIVGEMAVMLSGAFPMVKFAERHFGGALTRLARLFSIDGHAALGMAVSLANPIPMYLMLDRMTERGKVICSAFSAPILCLFGDYLGFITAAYPEGTVPMMAGKIAAAIAALLLALLLCRAEKREV